MFKNYLVLLVVVCFFYNCKEDVIPKPKAALRLEYKTPKMHEFNGPCNYSFEYNQVANLKQDQHCNLTISYPEMKGTIYISYKKIDNNLNKLQRDAEKLSYEHVAKADKIDPYVFENKEDKVYGVFL